MLRTNKIANKVLVFMVRGLTLYWKQPLGYFFACNVTPVNHLKTLLLNCIKFLFSVGLNVKVVVADQGSNNVGVFKEFDISISAHIIYTITTKYFLYIIHHI